MNRVIVGTLAALLLAVSLTVVGGARPAAAAVVCGNAATAKTNLCDESVTPSGGTTATTFLFKVYYTDQFERGPAAHTPYATVKIRTTAVPSVTLGTFTMVPTGGWPANGSSQYLPTPGPGVLLTYARTLPAGSYTYVFNAGQDGTNKVGLNGATTIVVTSPTPTPTPTPKPTPTPTPKPTPTPTPTPTPRPTPTPTPRPTPTPKPKTTPAPTPPPTATPTAVPPTDTPSASPSSSDGVVAIVGGPGSSTGPGGSNGAAAGPIVPSEPSGGSGAPFLIVMLCAAILSGLWWFLLRRRSRRPEPAVAPYPPPFGGPRPVLPAATIVPPKPDRARKPKAPPVAPAPVIEPAFAPTSAAAIPAAPTAALAEPFGEALMPRWRRPSLRTARYASPRTEPVAVPALTFAGRPNVGLERRRVRYDLVALTDVPDEIRGVQLGQLQANDEVEVIGREGAWVQVRTPLGAEGWVHRTTLRAIEDEPVAAVPQPPPVVVQPDDAPSSAEASIEEEVAMGAFAAAAQARALEVAKAAGHADESLSPAEPVAPATPAKAPRARRPAAPKVSKAAKA